MPDFEPKTRSEALLNAIRENTGGGTGSVSFTPVTREEHLLNEIRKNTETGGGDVTPASVASAIGGMDSIQKASARDALDAGLTPLLVSVDSYDHFSANYSQAEILAAIDAMRPVRVLVDIGPSTTAYLTNIAYDDSTGILEASGTGMMPDETLVSVVYTLDSNDVGNLIVEPLKEGPFVVELTIENQDFSGSMNVTVADIYEAYASGQEIRFSFYVPGAYRVEVPLNNINIDPDYDYPSFEIQTLLIDADALVCAYTLIGNDPDDDQFFTKVYPLTLPNAESEAY